MAKSSEHRDEDRLAISALQHFCFCERQFSLIHVERLWAENQLTAEGRLLHEKTDVPAVVEGEGVQIVRAIPLASDELGLYGVADTVEFLVDGTPFPVEYKHGRPNFHGSDEIQLCAQALCLEEMTGRRVPAGALFYGKTRRRKNVVFDTALREKTYAIVVAARALRERGETPVACYDSAKCDACSLRELCMPVSGFFAEKLEEDWKSRLLEDGV